MLNSPARFVCKVVVIIALPLLAAGCSGSGISADSPLGSLVMVVMAAVSLPCAWHLWRHPTASVWRFTALVDAAMLVLHLQMLGGSSAHDHMPGMSHGAQVSGLMWPGSRAG